MAPRFLLCPCLLVAIACGTDDESSGTQAETNADGSTTGAACKSDADLGCAASIPEDAQDGTMTSIMDKYGAPCCSDADCVTLIGEGAVCLIAAVIYELPQGYCSKPCDLPMGFSGIVPDDPACDPAGGVSCLGVDGTFEFCTVPCTDDAQCGRTGYYCRLMPIISQETDPTFCLMPDCCEIEDMTMPGCMM